MAKKDYYEVLGVIKSASAGQMVVKIVHDHLIKMLGEDLEAINLQGNPPNAIMMIGLQGSGPHIRLPFGSHLCFLQYRNGTW